MPPIRSNPLRHVAVVVALVASALAGCNYGSLSTWDGSSEGTPESAESDDDEEGSGTTEIDDSASMAEACLDRGPPAAGDAPARLLTNYEYRQTVRDLVGFAGNVSESFPPENKVNGFENNADAHVANRLLIRKYMKGAETISKGVVENRLDQLVPCDPASGAEACGHEFVRKFLPRAFRRPPTDAELQDFQKLFDEGHQNWGFKGGVKLVLQAVLQAPQFLYRIKLADGSSEAKTTRLDGYEMATRLSYLMWGSMPDEQLFEAASEGRLKTAEQIESQARRMLEDPRAKNAVYQFHRQWLHLDNFESVVKDAETFPAFKEKMTSDWRESMRRFVLDVYFSKKGDVERLLTSPKVFLSDRLAKLYGRNDMKADAAMDAYTLPDNRRAGLLTQPSLMALLANANQSSPIRRGVWVREQLLCQTLPPPPADANITPPDPDPDATTRERFHQHTANPQCAGCHAKIDPIGFGFSHYDSLGRWRARENGSPVNAKGNLADTGEPEIEGKFDGAVELADRLSESQQVRDCIAQRWFTYAMGGPPSESEKCALNRIQKRFAEAGGDFEEMLVAIATSDAFRYRKVADEGESK